MSADVHGCDDLPSWVDFGVHSIDCVHDLAAFHLICFALGVDYILLGDVSLCPSGAAVDQDAFFALDHGARVLANQIP